MKKGKRIVSLLLALALMAGQLPPVRAWAKEAETTPPFVEETVAAPAATETAPATLPVETTDTAESTMATELMETTVPMETEPTLAGEDALAQISGLQMGAAALGFNDLLDYESEDNGSEEDADLIEAGYTMVGSLDPEQVTVVGISYYHPDLDYFYFKVNGEDVEVRITLLSSYKTMGISVSNSWGESVIVAVPDTKTYAGWRCDIKMTLSWGTYYIDLMDSNSLSGYSNGYRLYLDSDECKHSDFTVGAEINPTCTTEGYVPYLCRECGYSWHVTTKEALGHDTVEKVTKEPTCAEAGTKISWCKRCEKEVSSSSIEKLPHTYGEYHVTEEPTCTEEGTEACECSECGDTLTRSVAMIPHTYGPSAVTKEPTCVEAGISCKMCQYCGFLQEEAVPVAPNHEMATGKILVKAPTASNPGEYNRECVRCSYSIREIIPAKAAYADAYVVEDDVIEIQSSAFRNHTLSRVTIPDGVTSIGMYAFEGCSNLTSIDIPDSVVDIGSMAFYNCDKLSQVSLSGSITQIRTMTFSGCSSLESIIIPNSVTYIGSMAFDDCLSLTSITFPESLTKLDHWVIVGCEALQKVCFVGDAPAVVNGAEPLYVAYGKSIRVFYPSGNSTWNYDAQRKLGSGADVTWSSCRHTFTGGSCTTPASCAKCGALVEYVHSYGDATCISPKICTVCGKNGGVALGHSFTQYYSNKDATCTRDGTKTATCDRCEVKNTIIDVGSKLKHTVVTIPATEPTCTKTGLTEGKYCSASGTVVVEQQIIPAKGHIEVADEGLAPTCTETGLTEGSHCSVCQAVLVAQEVIPANGHTEVVDQAVAHTCTETGLTEGSHCGVCSEILIPQDVVAAAHTFSDAPHTLLCSVCGYDTQFSLQEYVLLNVGQRAFLVNPVEVARDVQWQIEGDETVATITEDGSILAAHPGTVYVLATYGDFGTFRCRVDVAEGDSVSGVQLGTGKVTAELFSTDYAEFEVLLKLPQNYSTTASAADEIQDRGVAIEAARFTGYPAATYFDLVIKDDRTIVLVPTEQALRNPKAVPGSCKSGIAVTVQGNHLYTEEMTISVKKTQPKLKATVDPFNSFYPEELRQITITGATVTGISLDPTKAQPDWLTLSEDGILSLTEAAPRKNVSGKLNLLVETAEWAIPAAVTLTVKNAYKEPTLKLSARTVNLNTAVKDTACVTVTATPAVSELDFRLTDSTGKVDKTGELDVSCENGRFAICATDKASGSYKLHISTGGSKETALTIKVISAVPTVTYKVKGNPDLNIPEQFAEVTPTFKNYNGGFTVAALKAETAKKQDVTAQFWTEQIGTTIRVFCMENTPAGTYTLKLKLALDDGSFVENTARISVKQTALKVKLSASKLTLNKQIDDSASVTVTSATKGYTLDQPVWSLMDKTGKVSAEGKLDIGFEKGKLTAAVNEATEYGATYKLLVKANETSAAQTLTIAILAENKSAVTSTLKAKGNLDVIRDGSAVTLTAAYKNCADAKKTEELVFYKTVGKETVEVSDLFHYTQNADGTFTVTKAESAKLDHTGKYTVKLVTYIGGNKVCESKPITLAVKMGTAKLTLTAKDTVLFAKDSKDRAEFRIDSTDTALNGIAKIELKDTKQKNLFELFDYGNGTYAIGFKEGKVDKSLMGKTVTVNLNVFLNGNETAKVNTTVKVKLTVIP